MERQVIEVWASVQPVIVSGGRAAQCFHLNDICIQIIESIICLFFWSVSAFSSSASSSEPAPVPTEPDEQRVAVSDEAAPGPPVTIDTGVTIEQSVALQPM